MNNDIMILLPNTLYLKKQKKCADIKTIRDEYNIYYKNIVYPWHEDFSVKIDCRYGANLGNCWRLTDYFENENEFDLTLNIYEYGKKIASKSAKIVLTDKVEDIETKVMFIGDSMTFSEAYIDHIFLSLYGIKTLGTRTLNGNIKHEGRGGWSYDGYYSRWFDQNGMSPFLFPKNVRGSEYYGSVEFAAKTKEKDVFQYSYSGFNIGDLSEGMYFVSGKSLYKKEKDEDVLVSDSPEFEFDFGKYLERYNIDKPEIVSVLMGANDLQHCPYEETAQCVENFVNDTQKMIDAIHKVDKNIKIIINLPVLGSEQFAWGGVLKCASGEANYRYNIVNGVKALIGNFDNKQDENIYLCPMIACLDTENGFDYTYVKANMHTEEMVKKQCNWVHPNKSGYAQMGDALAGVIEYVRKG